jgi:hypothetical protein
MTLGVEVDRSLNIQDPIPLAEQPSRKILLRALENLR